MTSFNFKTLTKKVYPANRVTLFFSDKDLEYEYQVYLARLTLRPFMVTAAFVPIWSTIALILFLSTRYWNSSEYPHVAYIPLIAIVWGILSLIVGRTFMKRPDLLKFVEPFYGISLVVYVGFVIIFIHTYMLLVTGSDIRSYVGWVACLIITFSVCQRSRIPTAFLSCVVVILVDTIISLTVEKIGLVTLFAERLLIELTSLLTVMIFVYQSECNLRRTFLNEMEYENWKIDPHDISIATSLGTGTYGEVSRGTYKRYEVAVKKIIPHNSTESRTATEVSIPASNNSRKNGILPLWTSKKENSASKKEDHKAQEKIFDKFEAEIRLMCGLRHPNIVTFMGACLTKPNMLLVTEFCEIGSLFDFLVDPGYKPIDFYKKLDFVCGSAYGLQYLHSQEPPILHRDFKSLSILIDVHFNVKVCDFGLSQFASEFQRGSSAKPRRVSKRERKVKEESEVKKIVGSIPWVAPELFLHKPHTEKSDLYSLGIVIWEIFAEDHPYMQELNKEQMSVQDLIGKILNENYRPLNSKNGDEKYLFALPEIYDLMTRLWHKNCLSRPEWRSIVDVLESMKVTSRSMKNNARDRRSTTSWTDASSFRELSHSKFRPEPELRAPEETHTTEDQVVIPNFKFTFMTDSELDDHPFEESEPQQTMPLRITASFYHSTIMSSPDAAKNPIEKSKALGTSD